MTKPDVRGTYRWVTEAWPEARSKETAKERWADYGTILAAYALIPFVALTVLFSRNHG